MIRHLLAPLAAALLLTGCTQTIVSPVSVTRFVGAQPARLGQGPIAVRPAPGAPGTLPDFEAFENAVAAGLTRLGYQVVPGDSAAQVAELRVLRTVERPVRGRGPVSVGVGGETSSYGSGVGLGLGIDLTPPPPEVASTQMAVVIRDTASGQSLWEGRAEFSASKNTAYASAQATAQKMADALFSGFPGRSGETIEVK
jgi:hypothetical protein